MKKGRPYARTTITIPMPLKRRMKRVKDYVNWSSVACRAFEDKLTELDENKGEVMNMKDAVERLRRLKRENSDEAPDHSGQEAGREWAMNTATPEQLERLDSYRKRMVDDQWGQLFEGEEAWRELAKEIEPWAAEKPPRQKRFWKQILGDGGKESPGFYRGFAEGAIDVWHQVRDQL